MISAANIILGKLHYVNAGFYIDPELEQQSVSGRNSGALDVGDKELPVVITELGRYRTSYLPFNGMIAEPHSFRFPICDNFGERFARKMLILQKKM